jgi:hypothetical protein
LVVLTKLYVAPDAPSFVNASRNVEVVADDLRTGSGQITVKCVAAVVLKPVGHLSRQYTYVVDGETFTCPLWQPEQPAYLDPSVQLRHSP